MAEQKLSEVFAEMTKLKGFPVLIGSEYCKKHNESKGNCVGCESEEGCNRSLLLGLAALEGSMYHPCNYADYEAMRRGVNEKMDKILDKSFTLNELRKLV